jgi:hypothetical protein
MDASCDNVIAFPGRDAGSMAWRLRGMENGARNADLAMSAMAESSVVLAACAAAEARFAEDAREVVTLLARLSDELEALRQCGVALGEP